MLFYKGYGLWALLIPTFIVWTIQGALYMLYGGNYYQSATWVIPLGFQLASVPVFIWGYKLNSKPGRRVRDVKTGERFELKETHHSFFWIPMQYWGLILIGASLWIYARGSEMISGG